LGFLERRGLITPPLKEPASVKIFYYPTLLTTIYKTTIKVPKMPIPGSQSIMLPLRRWPRAWPAGNGIDLGGFSVLLKKVVVAQRMFEIQVIFVWALLIL
jgi:hypothetical protein